MPFRLLALALALAAAACGPAAVAPTPTPPASPPATPPLTGGNAGNGGTGNVDGTTHPELEVLEQPGRLLVALTDPAGKAWRLRIAGTGANADERLEILVETGDVEFTVLVRSLSGGELVDETELTGLVGVPTAAAGGCHPTIEVCYGSTGFDLPADGNGRLEVALELPTNTDPLTVTGATSGWTEPFVFGPWVETETYATQS